MSAALAVAIAALAVVSYVVVDRSLSADIDRTLLRETEAYTAAVSSAGQATDTTALVEVSRDYLAARTHATATTHPVLALRLSGGRVLSNSEVRIETARGNTGIPPMGFGTVTLGTQQYRVATAPIVGADGTTVLGVFQAALDTGYVRGVASDLAWTLVLAGLVIVAIGSSLSVFVARSSLRPLRRVVETAGRIGQSSLTERVPYTGPGDEVGTMVTAFNSMLDRLEAAFGEQRRFVADASHELRTPLAIVRGNIDLIQHPNTTAEQKREAFVILREELGRLERLVTDLLALARLEAGPTRAFQPLDVATLLIETAGRTRALGPRDIRVNAPGGAWIDGDPDMLEQALMNLTRNAVAHTREGGAIELDATRAGDLVRISVADDGDGLKAEDLPRVFDRFYRAHGPRTLDGPSGGSGLGLAITKRLVELHGGRVEAANRPEGGAVFTLYLPRREPPR